MAKGTASQRPSKQAQIRQERMKAALKANMARRKAQARARAAQEDTGYEGKGPGAKGE